MSLIVTGVKNKVNRPNACFTTLCQSTDFDDQSNLSPIVRTFRGSNRYVPNIGFRIPPPPGGTAILPEYIHYYGYYYQVIVQC
jgi:hypothetical protein